MLIVGAEMMMVGDDDVLTDALTMTTNLRVLLAIAQLRKMIITEPIITKAMAHPI